MNYDVLGWYDVPLDRVLVAASCPLLPPFLSLLKTHLLQNSHSSSSRFSFLLLLLFFLGSLITIIFTTAYGFLLLERHLSHHLHLQ